jgi:hypothetical protein
MSAAFFGREEDVSRGVSQLVKNRFLAVIGPSGIGKTSLIQAGIIPALRAHQDSIFDPIVFCRFGDDPLSGLAKTRRLIAEHTNHGHLLLVIDQFEEVYTLVSEVDRQNALRELLTQVRDQRVGMLLALRSDFFPRLIEIPELARKVELSSILLGPLSHAGLLRAIVEPARLSGVFFEDGLVERIVADAGGDPATLPLLQIAMRSLVEGGRDRVITLSDYERLGSAQGSLSQMLERIWSSAEEPDRQRIRSLLLRLATPEGTRRAVPLDEFSEEDRPQVHRLVDERVLTMHLDPATHGTLVDITHDSIVRLWPRFAAWINEERDFLNFRRRISQAAELWASEKRDSSYLLSSGLLSQARELLKTRSNDLTLLERSFVEQSVHASDQFSAWKTLVRGLGFAKLEKELMEREERRTKIQDALSGLEKELRELESRKLQLSKQLDQQRQETETLTPNIFLSYASEDFPYGKPFYDKLKEQGLRPWLDREDLLPGVDWDREIVKQIRQSHFVLFCISKRSRTKRGYIQKELRTALEALQQIPLGQTFLIPVRLEECTVPDELSKYQYVDVFRIGEFDKLLKSMFIQWAESQQRVSVNKV